MATQLTGIVKSETADNAITQHQVLKITSTGVDVATAASDKLYGVAQGAAAAGEQVAVQLTGTAKCIASASLSKGAWVKATTGGKIAATTTDHDVVLGMLLEAAGADGDLVEVKLGVFTLSA